MRESRMGRSGLLIGLLLWAPLSAAEGFDFTAQLSIKNQYLGKLGVTVDDHPVLQPFLAVNSDSGWYGSLWLNIPLNKGNPKRSVEIEPTVGFRHQLAGWNWDWSLTLYDIQNPGLLDFSGDVVGPRLMLSRSSWYLEMVHAEADKANNGSLLGAGGQWQLASSLNLQASLNYVDGPFSLEPIVYSKVKVIWSLPISEVNVFFEAQNILQEQNRNETRRDQVAVGVSFTY